MPGPPPRGPGCRERASRPHDDMRQRFPAFQLRYASLDLTEEMSHAQALLASSNATGRGSTPPPELVGRHRLRSTRDRLATRLQRRHPPVGPGHRPGTADVEVAHQRRQCRGLPARRLSAVSVSRSVRVEPWPRPILVPLLPDLSLLPAPAHGCRKLRRSAGGTVRRSRLTSPLRHERRSGMRRLLRTIVVWLFIGTLVATSLGCHMLYGK